jgi:hypothetical protein
MSFVRYLHDLGCEEVEFKDKGIFHIMDTTLLEVYKH